MEIHKCQISTTISQLCTSAATISRGKPDIFIYIDLGLTNDI